MLAGAAPYSCFESALAGRRMMLATGSNRSHRTNIVLRLQGCNLDTFRILGQVGQESHRRPAVVEHAARCPETFREGHEHPENGPL
jgi:hypothetical protein